jgi:GT2 family glycosyltransferase
MLFLLFLLAPLDWLLMALFVCTEFIGRFLRRVSPQEAPAFPLPRPECSFVMISWNGRAVLSESLPALLLAVRMHGGDHEIIVVDNHSTDGSEEFIRTHFPEVRVIRTEQNLYFGGGNRRGISLAKRDVLVLMNSDTIVDPDFIDPLLAVFEDSSVFGVASLVHAAGSIPCESGKTIARFDGCDLEWEHEPVGSENEGQGYSPVFWLHRGAFAMDRRKYGWLGGLDELYDPFCLEDADLSYRAWKVGWKCLVSFASHVSHQHAINVSRNHALRMASTGEPFLRLVVRRNQYIFFWKNLDNFSMLLKHGWRSPRTRVRRARVSQSRARVEAHSFLAALKRVPSILKKKLVFAPKVVRTDGEIFQLFECRWRNAEALPSQLQERATKCSRVSNH